ncbi:hypothetical protein AVEN_137780-1 [Araneus ventricosus]|uniref:Uncharacterized protein n=1 Tax=Araneus ventricosus TaxID=182803 RepID=A0A4Y2M964_ARAVE|nr:hypothetical protein AVEN_137780-1 [Araneus ventricosus]
MGVSCTNVPEDIKNRQNLDDDEIISDDEAVEELLDEDADTDFEKEKFFQLTSPKSDKCYRVACMDRSSELCKEFDYLINKFAEYAKEITESEECRKNEETMKTPGGQTMLG